MFATPFPSLSPLYSFCFWWILLWIDRPLLFFWHLNCRFLHCWACFRSSIFRPSVSRVCSVFLEMLFSIQPFGLALYSFGFPLVFFFGMVTFNFACRSLSFSSYIYLDWSLMGIDFPSIGRLIALTGRVKFCLKYFYLEFYSKLPLVTWIWLIFVSYSVVLALPYSLLADYCLFLVSVFISFLLYWSNPIWFCLHMNIQSCQRSKSPRDFCSAGFDMIT